MVCTQGGGGSFEPPEGGGGGGLGKGLPPRPIAEPLCGVPFYPILGPRDGRGYVATLPTCGPPRAQGLCSLNRNSPPPVKVRGTGMA